MKSQNQESRNSNHSIRTNHKDQEYNRKKAYGPIAQRSANHSHSASKSLTEREFEVLELLSLEYTVKEISKILLISNHTVKTHIKNLRRKLILPGTSKCQLPTYQDLYLEQKKLGNG